MNDILVKYTWNGDVNLDGVVDAGDYFLIDSAFIGQSGPLASSKPGSAVTGDTVVVKHPAKSSEPDSILSQLFSIEPVL